ncbi:hypothetical protein BD289DRAFT_475111 [Coniella lustricola]|uniref:Uncharacterized protein n=1 Tax=Coniella lustricola TaxID=2025994 RepID=A0A2T3A4D5_9PEZI|nr:hypothetical protein BD289DRAFT_475111 [Coniella lustricola]
MSAMKVLTFIILNGFATALPASGMTTITEREPLTNIAQVNLYSTSTCGGTVQSFSVTSGASVCVAVDGDKASIDVIENDCATYVWSGTNCEGNSLHISGDTCTSVLYGSVSVQC